MAVQNPQTLGLDRNFLNNTSTALNAYNNYAHSCNTINNISKAFEIYIYPELPQNPPPLTQGLLSPQQNPTTPNATHPKPAPVTSVNLPSQELQDLAQPLKPPIITIPKNNPERTLEPPISRVPKSRSLLPTRQASRLEPNPERTQTVSPNQNPQTRPQNLFVLRNPTTKLTPEEAATTLQRAFRYSRPALKQAIRTRQPLTDQAALELNLKKRKLLRSSAHSIIPRPQPGTNAVNPQKAVDWVYAHPPAARKLAKQFLSCITYRSQKKFEKQLQLTIQDFNRHLASMPIGKRDYIILVDRLGSLYKSDGWVQLLALKYLMTDHLVQIISYDLFHSKSPQLLPYHNILICDDGAYSGQQMGSTVFKIEHTGKKIFLAIPFMTQQSKQAINPQKNNQIHICKNQIIFTLKELRFQFDSDRSAFIFNHKVADAISTPDDIIKHGYLLNEIIPKTAENTELLAKFPPAFVKVPFINNPDEHPPYKVKSKL